MKKLFLLICFVVFIQKIQATHIACGTMYYKYVGTINNGSKVRYQLTAKLYRDASISTNASLDDEIEIGAYTNKQLYATYKMSLTTSIGWKNLDYQEGVYSTNIDLDSGKEYIFVYARCCLTQFVNVEYEQGFSLYSYMQNSSNNSGSPYLTKPAIDYIISIKGKKSLDYHAIDNENDSLRYEIVEPLIGGDKNSPKPVILSSIDSMFIPYYKYYVNFNFSKGYSLQSPFGSFAKFSFDSISGIAVIDSPKYTQGRFYWCIKISEYRNNVLIGITYLPVCSHFNPTYSNNITGGITDELRISPNPFTNTITISGFGKSITHIGVYDITGKQMDILAVPNSNQVTYSSNIPNGLYFLRFMDENGNVVGTQKLVKQ